MAFDPIDLDPMELGPMALGPGGIGPDGFGHDGNGPSGFGPDGIWTGKTTVKSNLHYKGGLLPLSLSVGNFRKGGCFTAACCRMDFFRFISLYLAA